jgi:CRP-like cAMP-binding protein
MGLWNVVRRTYRRLTRRREDTLVREAATTLAEASLFQGFPRRALRALSEAVHARTFRRGEFLYYEDDPGLGLYVVQQGRVRLTTEDEHGEPRELRRAGPGEVFGELSLLGDFPRMETARAVVETQVLGFFRPDLKTMLRRRPQAAAAVVEALAAHLARRQVAITRLAAEEGLAAEEEGPGDDGSRIRRLLEDADQRSLAAGPPSADPFSGER